MTPHVAARSLPIDFPRFDSAAAGTVVVRLLRILLLGYCYLGLVSYKPAVDSNGTCSCLFCEPFSIRSQTQIDRKEGSRIGRLPQEPSHGGSSASSANRVDSR